MKKLFFLIFSLATLFSNSFSTFTYYDADDIASKIDDLELKVDQFIDDIESQYQSRINELEEERKDLVFEAALKEYQEEQAKKSTWSHLLFGW